MSQSSVDLSSLPCGSSVEVVTRNPDFPLTLIPNGSGRSEQSDLMPGTSPRKVSIKEFHQFVY